MIIMNLELDNLFAFEQFKINFSYPKKIVNSSIPGEYLTSKPNFRYKKVNILMGANASGKTSLGIALIVISAIIESRNLSLLDHYIRDQQKSATFSVDFLVDEETLYRLDVKYSYLEDDMKTETYLMADLYSARIAKNDSYETCVKKLKLIDSVGDPDEGSSILKKIPNWPVKFSFTENGLIIDSSTQNNSMDIDILSTLLTVLDPQIDKVEESKEVENTYIIRSKNGDIVVQDGQVIKNNILSSGTESGIDISYIMSSMKKKKSALYYCDEKLSYVHSDVEKAILSTMIDILPVHSQLFFTSHNLDLLDMQLPIHSFTFLRKAPFIEAIDPSHFIKKNDVSLRRAVENDVFNIAPAISSIFNLGEDSEDETI